MDDAGTVFNRNEVCRNDIKCGWTHEAILIRDVQ